MRSGRRQSSANCSGCWWRARMARPVPAHATVVGIVENEDHPPEVVKVRLALDVRSDAGALLSDVHVLEGDVVSQHLGHVGVASNSQRAQRCHVHRVARSQVRVRWVRIYCELRVERVQRFVGPHSRFLLVHIRKECHSWCESPNTSSPDRSTAARWWDWRSVPRPGHRSHRAAVPMPAPRSTASSPFRHRVTGSVHGRRIRSARSCDSRPGTLDSCSRRDGFVPSMCVRFVPVLSGRTSTSQQA